MRELAVIDDMPQKNCATMTTRTSVRPAALAGGEDEDGRPRHEVCCDRGVVLIPPSRFEW